MYRAESYARTPEISKMELFALKVDCFYPLIIAAKHSILNIYESLGYSYLEEHTRSNSYSQFFRTSLDEVINKRFFFQIRLIYFSPILDFI